MTPQQKDVIAAGIAVRSWPQPSRVSSNTSEEFVIWTWPAHPTCPTKYRDANDNPQTTNCGIAVLPGSTAETISERFADMDAVFELEGFCPVAGAFARETGDG